MKRRSLSILFAAALTALFVTNTSTSAEAAYEDCAVFPGFCLWENQDFTGRMHVLAERGCHNASEVGLAAIGSARSGYGWMSVYTGENCTGTEIFAASEGTVFDPPGKSFRFWRMA
ncbi:peptidase inhibitor family I36 protein [Streptomyces sp. NPDC050211]|uniref:peptidase inhibitor family I36 protein n=1 Tax=Streptomyces sp. NPDC050211 TaxID=3154932 RepID=UPI00343AF8E9